MTVCIEGSRLPRLTCKATRVGSLGGAAAYAEGRTYGLTKSLDRSGQEGTLNQSPDANVPSTSAQDWAPPIADVPTAARPTLAIARRHCNAAMHSIEGIMFLATDHWACLQVEGEGSCV